MYHHSVHDEMCVKHEIMLNLSKVASLEKNWFGRKGDAKSKKEKFFPGWDGKWIVERWLLWSLYEPTEGKSLWRNHSERML